MHRLGQWRILARTAPFEYNPLEVIYAAFSDKRIKI